MRWQCGEPPRTREEGDDGLMRRRERTVDRGAGFGMALLART